MKRVIIRNSLILIATLFVSFLILYSNLGFVYNEEEKKETEAVEIDKTFSLVMVGDGLIHGAVYDDAKTSTGYDFTSMLSEMKPIISSYDLAFYNQESILGGTELGLSTYPRFNSPYETGDAFIDAGFNLVSLANNHTLDRGEKAIINSSNYWKTKDVYVAGSYATQEDRNTIVVKEKNGIKYALLAYTCWTNGLSIPDGKTYLLNRYDEQVVKADIESVRDRVDVLMVSMHFGNEYSFTPSNDQRKIASYLSSLGVDIIIGHHPHVVQPIEFIDDTLVVYSLGNFLSGQRGVEKLTGLMVSLDIVKDFSTDEITFQNIEAELTYTYTDNKKGYRGNYKVYPYTKLTESLLPNHESYYNKYMEIAIHGDDRIGKSDYSGNSK